MSTDRDRWDVIALASGASSETSGTISGGASVGRRVASALIGDELLREAVEETRSSRRSAEATWSLLALLKPVSVQEQLVEEMLSRDDLHLGSLVTASLFASVVDCESVARVERLMESDREYAVAGAARALREMLLAGCDVESLATRLLRRLEDAGVHGELKRSLTAALPEGPTETTDEVVDEVV